MAKKVKNDEIKRPKSIGPFDIIKMMFTDKESFDKLSNVALSKNFFMINRIMSIQFPMQAQFFNKLNINSAQTIKAWQQFATTKLGYGKVPYFVYTKTNKATNTDILLDINKEDKIDYCKHYNISLKDLDEMLYFNYNNTINHINEYLKVINSTKVIKES